MGLYEQDPDFVRWGLQLFDGDQSSICGYCDSVTQNDTEYYHEQYFKEDYYGMGCDVVENDELLAHALQEEFSQMSLADAPSSLCDEVAHSEVSYYPQEWLHQSAENYNFGQDIVHEDTDDTGMSSLCSTSGGSSLCEEECSSSLQLDEYAFDGEVGKRLNQMVSIPHVPKINGDIPSIDEATLDHQRLLDRLQLYELVELKVRGDGNCQFRSLSDQFYRTPEHHKFVRQQVVNQLKSCREIYEGYVPMAYGDYIKKMSKDGEWGDHVTLQAAADLYGVKIFVITSFKDTCYIEILPNIQRSNRVISLSFWAEVHYNSIYPEGDVPTFETKKKKRQWTFRDKHLELQDEYSLRE